MAKKKTEEKKLLEKKDTARLKYISIILTKKKL